MAHWILYALAVAAVLSGAALLLNRALRLAGRGARWCWLLAMLASTLFLMRPWFDTSEAAAAFELAPALGTPVVEAWLGVLDRAVLRLAGSDGSGVVAIAGGAACAGGSASCVARSPNRRQFRAGQSGHRTRRDDAESTAHCRAGADARVGAAGACAADRART